MSEAPTSDAKNFSRVIGYETGVFEVSSGQVRGDELCPLIEVLVWSHPRVTGSSKALLPYRCCGQATDGCFVLSIGNAWKLHSHAADAAYLIIDVVSI
jgi:hypothetical protein